MSRIGEIYRLENKSSLRYFQFVARDETNLNSDVIAVFKYQGTLPKDDATFQALHDSGVEFFMHTSVSPGVRQGLWTKIGKSVLVDTSEALFKQAYYEDGLPDVESDEADHYHNWVIWHINEDWQHIGDRINDYPNAWLGPIFAPKNAAHRIIKGEFPGPPYYGFKQ